MRPARALALALLLAPAVADVYMHNPRGSNDRNCERNVNRNNGNRMFDSQNNAKGGYACPRAVGDENVQAESGAAATGSTIQQKKVYYYEGSYLPIEWTNQHGCGQNSKTNCEINLQYMCEDTADPQVADLWPYTDTKNPAANANSQAFRAGGNIAAPRDGIPNDANDAATDTIPDNEDNAIPDTQADRRYGMHESYDFYQLCQRTERNNGLYTADQRIRRNDARGTRQNPNGDRRGLECPEERDYYPWWSPSPWVDVAVLTNDGPDAPCSDPDDCADAGSARCEYYLDNSFNRKKKGFCDIADGQDISAKTNSQSWNNRQWPNNEADCAALGAAYTWKELSLKDMMPDTPHPTCAKTQFARVNQLGNADGTIGSATFASTNAADWNDDAGRSVDDAEPQTVNANRFLWQLPSVPVPEDADDTSDASNYFRGADGNGMEDAYQSCVLRLRYNITTSDFPAWPAEAMEEGHPWANAMVDARNNSDANNAASEATPLLQDPYIYVGPGDDDDAGAQFVSLAVNTNQYARTFQDRSYTFSIKKRPTKDKNRDDEKDEPAQLEISSSKKVFNLNVRGKRGNIVQTYPAVEYDFVPNSLAVDEGDMVHFQWTGSDYNPRRGCNDAEGGPPDPNDFTSGANANQNSRADRTNLVMMNTMAENLPMDMLGYDADDDGGFNQKYTSAEDTVVSNAPCGGSDADECYNTMMRLTYLNQQSDGGAIALRRSADCLTEEELDDINDKNTRENHPLNCAKLNAKPYPYFDAGVMKASQGGKFSFFSSRNNNFSNRDQTGILCVRGKDDDGGTTTCDTTNGVLQDTNNMISTAAMPTKKEDKAKQDPARCNEEASANNGRANNFGAASCLEDAEGDDVLTGETQTIEQKDNDAVGDGNKDPCDVIFWDFPTLSKVEQALILGLVLMAVGICCVFSGNYIYNMYFRKAQQGKNFDVTDTDWKKGHETGKDKTVV